MGGAPSAEYDAQGYPGQQNSEPTPGLLLCSATELFRERYVSLVPDGQVVLHQAFTDGLTTAANIKNPSYGVKKGV
jgi:hypothetical protein